MPLFIEVHQVNDSRIFLNADMITMFAEEGNGNASIILKNGRVIYTENNYDNIKDSYEAMRMRIINGYYHYYINCFCHYFEFCNI